MKTDIYTVVAELSCVEEHLNRAEFHSILCILSAVILSQCLTFDSQESSSCDNANCSNYSALFDQT